MKKISTLAIEGMQVFKPNQLTIGLDLGDRISYYCILNEAGEIVLEQELPTTPKGFEPVFSKIPRSRIALETGTHSPWVSRQLTGLGTKCSWRMGATTVLRTPTLQRAIIARQRLRMEGWRPRRLGE